MKGEFKKNKKPKGYCCPMCNNCSKNQATGKKHNKTSYRQKEKQIIKDEVNDANSGK